MRVSDAKEQQTESGSTKNHQQLPIHPVDIRHEQAPTSTHLQNKQQPRSPDQQVNVPPPISRIPNARGGPAAIEDKHIRLRRLADMSSESDETDVMLNYLLHKYRETIGQVKRQMLLRVMNADPVIVQNRAHCDNYKTNNQGQLLNVGSLNLWHLNPPWDLRRQKMVEFFKQTKPDIVGLQEVRFVGDVNQAQQLANDIGDPKYNVAFCDVHPEPQQGKNEGIAIISRHEILSTGSMLLGGGSPRNRKVFHAEIRVPGVGDVIFFVTHLTYEESKQCHQMLRVLEYMDSVKPDAIQILVGDLNIYFDYEWPLDLLTRPINKFTFHRYNPCASEAIQRSMQASKTAKFRDAWEDVYKDLARFPGSTFPNFQDQRAAHLDPCRPDRILIRNNKISESVVTCDTYLFGQKTFEWSGKDGAGVQRKGMKISDHKGVLTQLIYDPRQNMRYADKVRTVQSWLGQVQMPAPVVRNASPERYLSLHSNRNPKLSYPAKVITNLPHYRTFMAVFAFDGNPDTFFWSSRAPSAGEYFRIILDEKKDTSRLAITTGVQQMNGQDKVVHGTFSAFADENCSEVIAKTKIGETGSAAISDLGEGKPVRCLQLTIDEEQENWVVISEIALVGN